MREPRAVFGRKHQDSPAVARESRASLTGMQLGRKLAGMEVHFNPDQEAKLSRMAAAQGRAAEALVQEAVDRLLDYDEWFLREVEKGLRAADRGEFVEHSDIRKIIDSRYPG
jgi:predicted transcriptional regulator